MPSRTSSPSARFPVVAPQHSSSFGGFRFAVYPRRGGRTPELDDPKTLEWIGRFIGRIHAVGATKRFRAPRSADAAKLSATSRAPTC